MKYALVVPVLQLNLIQFIPNMLYMLASTPNSVSRLRINGCKHSHL